MKEYIIPKLTVNDGQLTKVINVSVPMEVDESEDLVLDAREFNHIEFRGNLWEEWE